MKFNKHGVVISSNVPVILDLIPKSNKTSRPQKQMTPESITIHNTGNPDATAKNNSDYVDNVRSYVSWHFTVGNNIVYQELPINEHAWHAGDGEYGKGNLTSIAIEISEKEGDKAYVTAIKFIAELLDYLDWDTDKLVPHKKWSGKNCPRLILPIWDSDFIPKIKEELRKIESSKDMHSNNVSEWALEPLRWVLMNKVSDGTRPKDFVTREELWTMLYSYDKMKGE